MFELAQSLLALAAVALVVFFLALREHSLSHWRDSGKPTSDEYRLMARFFSVRAATHADLPCGPDAPGYNAWYRWLRHEATDLQYGALTEYSESIVNLDRFRVLQEKKEAAKSLVLLAKFDPDDPERAALLSRVEEHLAQRTA